MGSVPRTRFGATAVPLPPFKGTAAVPLSDEATAPAPPSAQDHGRHEHPVRTKPPAPPPASVVTDAEHSPFPPAGRCNCCPFCPPLVRRVLGRRPALSRKRRRLCQLPLPGRSGSHSSPTLGGDRGRRCPPSFWTRPRPRPRSSPFPDDAPLPSRARTPPAPNWDEATAAIPLRDEAAAAARPASWVTPRSLPTPVS